MITEEQMIKINEQLYNLESAYNASISYIDYLNEQILYNDRLFECMQIDKRRYLSNKKGLQKERSKAFDEAKSYHKKAFFLRKQANEMSIGIQYM